jgi:capsular polysaccharide biosynthesis protein
LRDVEVTGEGFLVAGKRGVLAESTYLNPKTRAGFGRIFVGRPALALTRLSDEVLWIVGSSGPSRNYWHWTAQVLPAVLHGIESVESEFGAAEWKILTRTLEPYQRESLDILGISPNQIREVSASEIVRVPNLLYSSYLVEPWTPGRHRRMLADRLRTLAESSERHDRLFVSRRDSRRRRVLNEEELETFLSERGFVTVVPGDLPWRAQVDLFQSAKVIVGAHGAGLANLLFCDRGTKVLELGLDSYPSAADVVLGASSGLDYWMDFFPSHTATSRHLASVTIDTEVVESSLNYMGVT